MSATRNKFSPEFRDRAVRMVDEHRGDYPPEWSAMTSIAGKVGCTTETLRRWCREEASRRVGPAAQAANDRERLKLLEREVKELRRANEFLCKASAYFAQAELDRSGRLSIGFPKGPPIGAQKEPPLSSSMTVLTDAPFALVA